MKVKKEVLIIIPAYNEEKTIPQLLQRLEQAKITDYADVLVMNDASADATSWVTKQQKCTTVISHVFNLGYGSGLQLGYKYAIRRGYQYVIQMDADGQHDVCNISALYQALKTPDADGELPDIVLGARFMKGSPEFDVSLAKKIAFVLFRNMIRIGTGVHINDPTTGLQGLMQMLLLGFKIREIPAVMHQRTEGVSMHSGLKPFVYMFRMTFSIIAVWIREKILKIDVGDIDELRFYPRKNS